MQHKLALNSQKKKTPSLLDQKIVYPGKIGNNTVGPGVFWLVTWVSSKLLLAVDNSYPGHFGTFLHTMSWVLWWIWVEIEISTQGTIRNSRGISNTQPKPETQNSFILLSLAVFISKRY